MFGDEQQYYFSEDGRVLDPHALPVLCISAGMTHGAYTDSRVSHRLTVYSRNLYYLLAEMKDYKATPTAEPGRFTLSLEFLREQLGCKYQKAFYIRRYFLEPAQRALAELIVKNKTSYLVKIMQNGLITGQSGDPAAKRLPEIPLAAAEGEEKYDRSLCRAATK